MITQHVILTIDKLVFVFGFVGEDGKPTQHGCPDTIYHRDRLPSEHRGCPERLARRQGT